MIWNRVIYLTKDQKAPNSKFGKLADFGFGHSWANSGPLTWSEACAAFPDRLSRCPRSWARGASQLRLKERRLCVSCDVWDTQGTSLAVELASSGRTEVCSNYEAFTPFIKCLSALWFPSLKFCLSFLWAWPSLSVRCSDSAQGVGSQSFLHSVRMSGMEGLLLAQLALFVEVNKELPGVGEGC